MDAEKRVPIEGNLDIPAGTLKALQRKDIVTLGELTDLINRNPQHWHESVPGVGTTAARVSAMPTPRSGSGTPSTPTRCRSLSQGRAGRSIGAGPLGLFLRIGMEAEA